MMKRRTILGLLMLLFVITDAEWGWAQGFRPGMGSFPAAGNMMQQMGTRKSKMDSLQKRDLYADSITIFYKSFDSTRNRALDSSINDFTTRFPMPFTHYHLGNFGTAARSMLFNPLMKTGFDAGFHAFDIYKFTLENTRFYQTTRPYTELGYLLGAKAEQLIDLKHTQNRKSNFNFGFEYRFSNSPGALKNQNASHNNFRFTSHYQSNNRQYEIFFLYISNKSSVSENGGLVDVKKLDSLALNDPFELETRLGRSGAAIRNPFNTNVSTGHLQRDNMLLIRHHYDLGKKDSLVTDSATYKIFYPRFRIEHTLKYQQQLGQFFDNNVDSLRYLNYFNYITRNGQNFQFKDSWKILTNEFALISFPDKSNQSQFLKAAIALQQISGNFDTLNSVKLNNIYAIGEYRNRTKNQVWDLEAKGELYLNGYNAGDYSALVSMKRLLGKKIGYLNIGFHNVNRTPSFIFNAQSTFPVQNRTGFNKENIVKFFGVYDNPAKAFSVSAEYSLVSNYLYFDSFFAAKQEATLFNVVKLGIFKKFKLTRHLNWYTEIHAQKTVGTAPVNLPLIITRNRLAFEGNFYTNLFLSTGLEIRYNTPFKADGYSPLLGQFFYQNSQTFNNRPDMHAFLHFRIKSFKGFIRFENLNTLFSKVNLLSDQYPAQGVWNRIGIWWNFVN
ncbi:putative porin [Sediminibacterium salmoneum]|uniref:putative porin n=1 Tax=Sediminibacterium salmoneum TaxID=426421 RepID=UPI000A00A407|nr:putative porin [Sediminibacterium salmoneum]